MSEGGGVTRFSETSGPGGFLHSPLYLLLLLMAPIEKKKPPRRPSQSVISHNIKHCAGLTELFFQEEMLKNNTALCNSQEDFWQNVLQRPGSQHSKVFLIRLQVLFGSPICADNDRIID